MPTTRQRRSRTIKTLKPWERAFLTNDDSEILPGSRDEIRLDILRTDPNGWLMFGDRTARQLLKDYPEYRKR